MIVAYSRTYVREGVTLRVCIDCRQEKPLTDMFFKRQKSNEHGFNIRCKPCHKKFGDAYKERKMREQNGGGGQKDEPQKKMENGEEKTLVLNTCGHNYWYHIKKPGALEWLKTQACPRCRPGRRGNRPRPIPQQTPPPQQDQDQDDGEQERLEQEFEEEFQPEPEVPEPVPNEEWVKGIMELMPVGLYHSVLPELIMVLKQGIPVWLQGPPGTSKSTLAMQAAEGLDLSFHPLACHELMTRADLFGYSDANGIDHRTPLWDAYEHGGLVLLDEVDNGNPNLLAALNSALSNGHCVFGSGTVIGKNDDFRVVATANTAGLGPEHGYIGRNGVDLATRDRFVTIQVPIDEVLEDALAALHTGRSTIDDLASAFRERAEDQLLVRSCQLKDPEPSYITDAVRKIRALVEARFRGSVVSPRMTMHASSMVAAGFSLREALVAKLPGLKADEVEELLRSAEVP